MQSDIAHTFVMHPLALALIVCEVYACRLHLPRPSVHGEPGAASQSEFQHPLHNAVVKSIFAVFFDTAASLCCTRCQIFSSAKSSYNIIRAKYAAPTEKPRAAGHNRTPTGWHRFSRCSRCSRAPPVIRRGRKQEDILIDRRVRRTGVVSGKELQLSRRWTLIRLVSLRFSGHFVLKTLRRKERKRQICSIYIDLHFILTDWMLNFSQRFAKIGM